MEYENNGNGDQVAADGLTTDVTINANTMIITSRAIRMPLQLRWLGLADTSCEWETGRPLNWSRRYTGKWMCSVACVANLLFTQRLAMVDISRRRANEVKNKSLVD